MGRAAGQGVRAAREHTLTDGSGSGIVAVNGLAMAVSASAALLAVDSFPFSSRSVSGGSTMTFMGSTLWAIGLVGAFSSPLILVCKRLRETNGPAWLVTLSEGCRAGTGEGVCMTRFFCRTTVAEYIPAENSC